MVGANGSLTGYAGGVDKKIKLLELERADMKAFFVPKKGLRCKTKEKGIPRDSWVYVRQYCAEIDEAARNRMELIVRSLAEQKRRDRATES